MTARERPRANAFAWALAGAGTVIALACVPPTVLYESRVPIEPLFEKLRAAGGDPGKVLRVRSEQDLAALKPSRRYKYVVRADGAVVVAPRPADEAGNEYFHPVLAGGRPVRAAGYLRYQRIGAEREDFVVVDQDSRAYCPSLDSLAEARSALTRAGLARDRIRTENHAPDCAPLPDDGGAP